MEYAKVFGRFLQVLGRLMLENRQWLNNQLFIVAAYRAFLKREPDEEGRHYYLTALECKTLTRWGILRSMIRSSEFEQVYGFRIHPLDAQHQARMKLVRDCLPQAQVIVDLGGAARGHPEGALLAMGYPHRPREILIVDLPPSERLGGGQSAEASQQYVTSDGIRIQYFYRSMTDLSLITDESADLVWSGESIEHVTEADSDVVCQEAYRVLKPGGYFCLDTPNEVLTRLQSPDAFIHPEHKKEYNVHDLRAKLERWGFEVVEAKGICPMPKSIRNGIFDIGEITENIGLSDNPEECYMFYLKAVKPR